MDDSVPAELAPALAEPSGAAKDEYERDEQASQDELYAAISEMLGDHLTARGYAAWLRSEEEDE